MITVCKTQLRCGLLACSLLTIVFALQAQADNQASVTGSAQRLSHSPEKLFEKLISLLLQLQALVLRDRQQNNGGPQQ